MEINEVVADLKKMAGEYADQTGVYPDVVSIHTAVLADLLLKTAQQAAAEAYEHGYQDGIASQAPETSIPDDVPKGFAGFLGSDD